MVHDSRRKHPYFYRLFRKYCRNTSALSITYFEDFRLVVSRASIGCKFWYLLTQSQKSQSYSIEFELTDVRRSRITRRYFNFRNGYRNYGVCVTKFVRVSLSKVCNLYGLDSMSESRNFENVSFFFIFYCEENYAFVSLEVLF